MKGQFAGRHTEKHL